METTKRKYPDRDRYKIVRFYQNGRRRTMDNHLTLQEAQAYCKREDTRKEGEWFDGYTIE